jgi:hypothetical protein
MSMTMAIARRWQRPLLQAAVLACFLPHLNANATSPSIPWECSTYEGDAQTRCLNAFIELQRDKIDRLEGHLHYQHETVAQLKEQVERQATATADLQRQLREHPMTTIVPSPYSFAYVYPPALGLGLYFGQPWIYGPAPFYGPLRRHGFYRHW